MLYLPVVPESKVINDNDKALSPDDEDEDEDPLGGALELEGAMITISCPADTGLTDNDARRQEEKEKEKAQEEKGCCCHAE